MSLRCVVTYILSQLTTVRTATLSKNQRFHLFYGGRSVLNFSCYYKETTKGLLYFCVWVPLKPQSSNYECFYASLCYRYEISFPPFLLHPLLLSLSPPPHIADNNTVWLSLFESSHHITQNFKCSLRMCWLVVSYRITTHRVIYDTYPSVVQGISPCV